MLHTLELLANLVSIAVAFVVFLYVRMQFRTIALTGSDSFFFLVFFYLIAFPDKCFFFILIEG